MFLTLLFMVFGFHICLILYFIILSIKEKKLSKQTVVLIATAVLMVFLFGKVTLMVDRFIMQ